MLSKFNRDSRGQMIIMAIIGILASMVLVSLSSARDKAIDARIKSDLMQTRSLAELIYSDYETYSYLCESNHTLNQDAPNWGSQLATIENDIRSQQKGNFALKCYTNGSEYCVEVKISTGFYCVNSGGIAKENTVQKCNSNNLRCTP